MKPQQSIFGLIPRRLFIHGAFAGACSSLLSPKVSCAFQNKTAGKKSAGSALDQALDLLAAASQGSSTHAPMVAEALAALGRADAAVAWVERNKRENERPYPAASRPLKREDWRAALGDQSRRGEWVVFFQREIAETGWQSVLREWAAHLAPGMAAAAAHGLIRTAHAVRSLEAGVSAQRQRELAEGLGYWASWYQKLPAAPARERGVLKPAEALKQINPMPPDQVRRGNIVAAVSSLEDFPSFAPAINWVDASGDAAHFLSDLTETFVHAYLANAHNFSSTLRLVHAVTGSSAVRLLLPYAGAATKVELMRYGWQLGAALYAVSGRTPRAALPASPPSGRDELIERAMKNDGAHPIKFTEACLREYALNPQPVYLHAARHVIENLHNV